ncbi:MAG: GNAT family N-acetyltransferase [Actinomycetota bacterium]
MDNITIRPVTIAEYPAFVTALIEGFSDDLPDESFPKMIEEVLPAERTLAAFDGDTIVGTFGGYDLDLTVPGGTVKMEGTTVVTVFPTHRRMGLMDEMMTLHLDNAVANGYPVAGLWASSSAIYGRHGYGAATYATTRTLDGPTFHLRDGIGMDRVTRISSEQAADRLPPVFDRVCSTTPGMFARDETWWAQEVLRDEEWMKRGRTSHRIVIHEGPDGADGYVIYRQKQSESDDGHANGTVSVLEMIAETSTAKASLWNYIANIDGCPKVRSWNMPLHDDVLAMVREPRRFAVTALYDALWIRILDVEAALSQRTYEDDGTVVFSIVDNYRPQTDGTYRLTVSDGVGECKRTDEQANLDIDIDVLGALYLGGGDAGGYVAAGRLRGSDAEIATLHAIFSTMKTPWCNQVF